ncbi:PREDICTED: FHA domain-containing protein FhaA-like isoform X2 [Polistes dominula]|uniref:FHA domain-containing protein FhaA-like isoform X2 n=1 Tax=Polistes dominula TaxID=743375 RepID=A0ABM1IJ35_POLDO|nr:PREDICTED: FHA domain-containing protein FhaA-like isoform X2 [Polistes dominula]
MLNSQNLWVTLAALLVIIAIPDVASYSKYGRSCKDIGCRKDEVCVIAEDPCTVSSDKCGFYPTCKKTSNSGFQSAGVDVVNGQQVSNSDTNKHTNTNSNPYANANAPPAPADPVPGGTGYHQVNTGTNIGYPPYPSNVGSSNNNNGYPPYPSTNQGNHPRTDNLGYPPYPTMNRMPQPGQGYPGQGYPPYPGQSGYPQAGYPQQQYPNGQRYPVGQYPGYQNYPNQNHRGYSYNSNSVYRKNGSNIGQSASFTTVCLITLSLILYNRS